MNVPKKPTSTPLPAVPIKEGARVRVLLPDGTELPAHVDRVRHVRLPAWQTFILVLRTEEE